MKKSILALAASFAMISCGLTACDNNENEDNNQNVQIKEVKSALSRADSNISADNLKSFVKGQYDLNFDLIRASNEQISNNNAMISTFSIQMALGMTWGGADDDNAAEMKQVLHFDDNTHEALNKLDASINHKNAPAVKTDDGEIEAVEIKTSNNLYFATNLYEWSKDWLDLLATNYGAGLKEINFSADPEAARKYINDVVSDDTHNRIKDLIPENEINANTQAVITNAIYFKSPWGKSVIKSDNMMSFHKLDNSNVDVNYLFVSENLNYMADADNNYQAVSVPLRNDAFNVMFILPAENKFEEIQNSLNGTVISDIFDKMSDNTEVSLSFPSYSFETSLDLKSPLKKLGMVKAFEGGFQKMTAPQSNSLCIGEVFHKTFIGMDEKGVEAAAATAVLMENKATPIPEEKIVLSLDRPYYFVIYESDSKSPLFVGRVMDPSAGHE